MDVVLGAMETMVDLSVMSRGQGNNAMFDGVAKRMAI
jgi:hypothetical protein